MRELKFMWWETVWGEPRRSVVYGWLLSGDDSVVQFCLLPNDRTRECVRV